MGVSTNDIPGLVTAIPDRARLNPGAVREDELPPPMRMALESARAARPGRQLACVAFYTCDNGREVARMGPEPAILDGTAAFTSSLLAPKQLVVLSVTFTETTHSDVRTLTHVLVTRTQPNDLRTWHEG